jgi:cobalt-zinc-cadmium efflux system membrane fusion protein
MSYRNLFAVAAMVLVGVSLVACSKTADKTGMSSSAASEAGHSHEGWWCDEHGVPEEMCAQCDSGLVADFKAKGDWCEKHNRPDSQCFVCHPEKEAEFAALYEAKYGKQPPKPMAEGEVQEHPAEDKQS